MNVRPDPPLDSEQVSSYSNGDQVYFFRSGKWRKGEIQGQGGSSDESPRFLVRDNEKGTENLIAACDIRMRV